MIGVVSASHKNGRHMRGGFLRALLLGSGAFVAGFAGAVPATAQVDLPSSGVLETVVVTAQRRSEDLQRVPVAVSAFSDKDLAARQITETVDVARMVPNMVGHHNVGVGSANTYYLRGLGSTESIPTFDPPVGTYVDDVYIARQNMNNFSFFDVDHIEVMRGPQGTLFGRNTTGGAINVILKKPSDTMNGYVEGQYGRFNKVGGRASIDIPVSDEVLTKFSGFGYRDDGYATQLATGNKFNFDNNYGFRGAVRYLPTEKITWDLEADYIFENNTNQLNVVDPATGKRVSNSGLIKGALLPYLTGDKGGFDPLQAKSTGWAGTSNLAYDAGWATINFITGLRKVKQNYLTDSYSETSTGGFPTGAQPAPTDSQFRQFSQEIKLTGSALDDRLTYVAGFYYFYENAAVDLGSPRTSGTGAVSVLADRTVSVMTNAPAAYAQADYKLTDDLTVTAGVRFTDETKEFKLDRNPGALGADISTAGIEAAGIPTTLRTDLFTPRFALEYQITPDVMVYASATKGFKSGGWAGRATSNASAVSFKPEKIWSEEIGLRSNLFDDTLRLNATGYYGLTDDVQISSSVYINGTGVFTTTNPADMEDYGLELEAEWLPIEHLTINSSLGLQHAAFINVTDTVKAQMAACQVSPGTANTNCNKGFVDVYGNIATPARAPKYTWTMFASYEWDTGLVTITPTAGFTMQSEMSISTAGSKASASYPNPAVSGEWISKQTRINASVMFQVDDHKEWSLTLECRNCANKTFPVSFLAPTVFIDAPGTWDIRISHVF